MQQHPRKTLRPNYKDFCHIYGCRFFVFFCIVYSYSLKDRLDMFTFLNIAFQQ